MQAADAGYRQLEQPHGKSHPQKSTALHRSHRSDHGLPVSDARSLSASLLRAALLLRLSVSFVVSTGSDALRGILQLPALGRLLGRAVSCCRALLRRERLTRALERTCARGRTLLRRERLARPLEETAARRPLRSRRESRRRTSRLLKHSLRTRKVLLRRRCRLGVAGRPPTHEAGTRRRGFVRAVRDSKGAAGGRLRRAGHERSASSPVCALLRNKDQGEACTPFGAGLSPLGSSSMAGVPLQGVPADAGRFKAEVAALGFFVTVGGEFSCSFLP